MCGVGKRFKEAGYRDHKSMIKINNLNMLERIMNNFKDIHIDIYLITSEKIIYSYQRSFIGSCIFFIQSVFSNS